jgi:uncharacterized protein (DUF1697 family)
MKFVAFFRNVNLGRPKSPTKAQLESALTSAGAESVQSFLTNGTAVFAVETEHMARTVVARTCQMLTAVCGLEEPAHLCRLRHLADLVAANPFAGIDMEDVYQCGVSFMPAEAIVKLHAPLQSPRGDVEVIRVTSEAALSVTRIVGGRPGNATAFLEKMLLVPVTTRNWNTIVRLVEKHA